MLRRDRILSSVGLVLVLALPILLIAMRPRKIPSRAVIRAEQLDRLRFVAGRVTQYARTYHRPAYYLDSVTAHLDSTDAAEFRIYLNDLWGDPIEYSWDFTTFSLWSNAGASNVFAEAALDSALRQLDSGGRSKHETQREFDAKMFKVESEVEQAIHIRAWYGWPEAAQRDSMRLRREKRVENDRGIHD
jgi:hypothetical protein